MKYEQMKGIAEDYYVAAMIYKNNGNTMDARQNALAAISLYRNLDIKTLEDAAPTRMRVKGINLPDIMHEDVVRQRLEL